MKNKILKTVTAVAGVGFILTASALDSEGFTVNFICAGCLAWLVLFFIANRKRVMKRV